MNGNSNERSGAGGKVREQAIAWFVRMRGEEAEQLREEFERWLAEAPAHRREYGWIEHHFTASSVLKRPRIGQSHARRPRVSAWPLAVAAAAAIALFLVRPGLFAPAERDAQPLVMPMLTNGHGQITRHVMPDGTKAVLDSDTQVEVELDRSIRHLRLRRGRARFAVGDDRRPFRVSAGENLIEAQNGSAFDVALDEPGIVVMRVISGAASIRNDAGGPTRAVALPLGQTVVAQETGIKSVAAKDVTQDWPSGWAEYSSISLGELVSEANRYAAKPVRLDPDVRHLRVSGRFHLTDSELFVARLCALFDLRRDEQADAIYLRRS